MRGANNADLAVFFHHCARTGLDPFARQIYLIGRGGKQTIQTGVDGFRLVARRNRLLGEWAAAKMGLSEEETSSYAKDVIRADFEEAGDEDVVRKVLGDLMAAGVTTDEASVRRALDEQMVEARRQLLEAH